MGTDIEANGSDKDVGYNVREIPAPQDEKRDAVFGEITDKGPNYRAVRTLHLLPGREAERLTCRWACGPLW